MQEEIWLQSDSKQGEVDMIGFVKKKKGTSKGYKKNEGADTVKELSKMMCFWGQEMGHYMKQCPSKKNGKAKQQI